MFGVFSKMKRSIHERHEKPGFYLYLIFPMSIAFLITFVLARSLNLIAPGLHFSIAGIHIHHFVWGISILAISGYLALIFSSPKEKYLVALLHGLGLGLAFDEFGFWLKLTDDDIVRWSYDGFFIIMGVFLLVISAKRGVQMLKTLWPFGSNQPPK